MVLIGSVHSSRHYLRNAMLSNNKSSEPDSALNLKALGGGGGEFATPP